MAERKPMPPIPENLKAIWPLSWHAGVGQFTKKKSGRVFYFGSNPAEAFERFAHEWPYLSTGRDVPTESGFTVNDLVDSFLKHQEGKLRRGQIKIRRMAECQAVGEFLRDHLGLVAVASLTPADFAGLLDFIHGSPTVRGSKIGRVKQFFKFGYDQDLLDRPVKFGSAFKAPPMRERRIHKAKQTDPVFTAAEIRAFLAKASPLMKAAILLGINAGMYAIDVAELEHRHIQGEWVIFPRGKTGIDRKFWMWPETREAIEAVIDRRGARVFARKNGEPLMSELETGARYDVIGVGFWKLKRSMNYKEANRGFKSLRKTFRTVADAAKDDPAVLLMMGHADQSISAAYRDLSATAEQRLIAVAQLVRTWLYGEAVAES